jgi:lipopolysaccharide/colanic/teichoic acid biosynthesis glycosyltransferase
LEEGFTVNIRVPKNRENDVSEFESVIFADSQQLSKLDSDYLGKRIFDIAFSVLMLLIYIPILLPLIAIAIKLDSRGPVFYNQTRIGLNRRKNISSNNFNRRSLVYPGRPFLVYKLRTMYIDAENNGPMWATENDSRITRVGAFLRKSRLDEFPQFYNVLKGEMSIIGPRPERLCFIRKLESDVPEYNDRLLVLPGITGLAQVVNGYDTDLESVRKKVALDKHYINNRSLLMDIKILFMTIGVVVSGRGAN